VLLKNDRGTLPLAASVKKIAVIGPAADDPVAPLGNYNGFSRKQVAPLKGMEQEFADKAQVHYAMGATYTSQTASPVSSEALTPPSGSGHGVLAEYYDNPELNGKPRLSRVEPRPYYDGLAEPNAGEAGRGAALSIRWTGTLHPPVGGRYQFSVGGCRTSHFVLDGNEITAPQAAQTQGGFGRRPAPPIEVELAGDRGYALRIDCTPFAAGRGATISWIPPAAALLAEAVKTVKNADVAVAFVGLNPNLEGEEMPVSIPGFAGGDRTDLNLPEAQQKLLEAAVATGKPVVVVLASGSAVAINYAAEHAAAVLQLWYGGEMAGTAIAETLAGVNNPAGRLPVTIYRSVSQLPPFDDYSMRNRTYRYFQGDPLWGFGFGLSYSRFTYSRLRARRTEQGAEVTVRVKNDSSREGDEVAQVYVAGAGGADDPLRQLSGFQRVHLRAGETREVRFSLGKLPKGKVRISVGGGQPILGIPHVDAAI
jgi:beta-glucosidase